MKSRYVLVRLENDRDAKIGLAKKEVEIPFGAKDDTAAVKKARRLSKSRGELHKVYKFVEIPLE